MSNGQMVSNRNPIVEFSLEINNYVLKTHFRLMRKVEDLQLLKSLIRLI